MLRAIASVFNLTARNRYCSTAGVFGSFEPIILTRKEAVGIITFDRPSAVDAALETTLSQGMKAGRRSFHSIFVLEDQKEGMKAFIEKRKPVFKNR